VIPPADAYVRRILEIRDVHDGDTYRFLVDQGLGDGRDLWVRLHGLDCWELDQPLGPAARQAAKTALEQATTIAIQTFKTRGGQDVTSFIRYVADVWVDNVLLADVLRAGGFEKKP
jgi:endonuclease YncB( thermonuclease family)